MRRRRKPLSPAAWQALLCAGTVALCALFGLVVWLSSRTRKPQVPEPQPVTVAPAVDPQSETGPLVAPPPIVPVHPEVPAVAQPGPAARPLTEQRFVEVSALIVLAGESFTDSEIGRQSLALATEAILEENGVDRAAFERMSEEIAADPARRSRVEDQVRERVDRLKQPRDLRVGTSQEPGVDPRRRPPRPPRPARPTPPTSPR